MAIREMMTVRDGDQLSPMGYGTFFTKWTECKPDTDPGRGREMVRSSSEKSIFRGIDSADLVDLHAQAVYDRHSQSSGKSSRLEQDFSESPQGRTDGQEAQFREWFEPITSGIIHIAEEKAKAKSDLKGTTLGNRASEDVVQVPGDFRLRDLQHRLVDLIDVLDSRGELSEARRTRRAWRFHLCECSVCKCCPPEPAEHQFQIWNWNLRLREYKDPAHD